MNPVALSMFPVPFDPSGTTSLSCCAEAELRSVFTRVTIVRVAVNFELPAKTLGCARCGEGSSFSHTLTGLAAGDFTRRARAGESGKSRSTSLELFVLGRGSGSVKPVSCTDFEPGALTEPGLLVRDDSAEAGLSGEEGLRRPLTAGCPLKRLFLQEKPFFFNKRHRSVVRYMI